MYLGMATSHGSNHAAYTLGAAFLDGTLPTNKTEARRLLELSLRDDCKWDHLKKFYKEEAQKQLDKLNYEV